jgi:hypothetical protein
MGEITIRQPQDVFKTAGFNRSRTSPLVIATFFRTPDRAVMFKIPLVMPQGYDVTATGSRWTSIRQYHCSSLNTDWQSRNGSGGPGIAAILHEEDSE